MLRIWSWKPQLLACLWLFFNPPAWSADKLDQSRSVVSETNQQLHVRQKQINTLHDSTEQIVDQYKTVLREIETYRVYNRQLGDIVDSQKADLDSLQNQIIEIEVTGQQIMPMMQRMIVALGQFIDQDVPFLPVERSKRLAKLDGIMRRADITVAEKYRKILEAYQIEIDYGKTLEAYDGELDQRNVSFLKVGRIAFYYRTPDGRSYAIWNPQAQSWQAVSDHEVIKSIDLGLKIARKQQSPELLTIRVGRAEGVQ